MKSGPVIKTVGKVYLNQVTFEGLEEQLLGDVVIKEKPEVEAQRDKIVI